MWTDVPRISALTNIRSKGTLMAANERVDVTPLADANLTVLPPSRRYQRAVQRLPRHQHNMPDTGHGRMCAKRAVSLLG